MKYYFKLNLLCFTVCYLTGFSPAFAEEKRPLLSPIFSLKEQSANQIILSWRDPAEGTKYVHSVLLFAPGEVQGATASVSEFTWNRITKENKTIQGDKASFPPAEVKVSPPHLSLREIGFLSGCRIAVLTLSLPSMDSRGEKLGEKFFFSGGEITVTFPESNEQPFLSFPKALDPLAQRLFINYPPRSQEVHNKPDPPQRPELLEPIVKVRTREEGIVVLSAQEILNFDHQSIPLQEIALFQRNQAVAFQVLDADHLIKTAGLLEPNDSIRFYVPSSDSPYSPETTTLISRSTVHHKLIPEIQEPRTTDAAAGSVMQRLLLEEDVFFIDSRDKTEEQSSYWMWHNLVNDGSATIPIFLPEQLQNEDVTVRLHLFQDSGRKELSKEGFSLWWNDQEITTSILPGEPEKFILQGTVPAAWVQPGSPTVVLSLAQETPEDTVDPIYLDRGEIDYSATVFPSNLPFFLSSPVNRVGVSEQVQGVLWVYDRRDGILDYRYSPIQDQAVSYPNLAHSWRGYALSRVSTGVSYSLEKVPRGVERTLPMQLDELTQADVLIISPRDWQNILQPYEQLLAKEGYRSQGIAVEDIYDFFGDGRLSPHAIHQCLQAYFYYAPKPAPSFVIFVGDATWDYWGRYKNGIENIIPAYRKNSQYAVENWFARLDDQSDPVPDMIVGRFPVRNADELQVLVNKIVHYRQSPSVGDWYNKVFLLTDDGFENYTEELARDWLPKGFRLTQRHIADYPLIDNFYLPERLRASMRAKTSTAATIDIVNILNEGVFLWEYFGHGAPNVIGEERMFFGGGSQYSDVKKLHNGMMLPMLWAFTCETATFDYPKEKWNLSIGEDLLTHTDGGIIALLGATGRGYPYEHLTLAQGMHAATFEYGFDTLGQAFMAAGLMGLAQQSQFEPIDQFALLGDPTLLFPKYHTVSGEVTITDNEWRYEWKLPLDSTQHSLWPVWSQTSRNAIVLATESYAARLEGILKPQVSPYEDIVRLGVDQIQKTNPRVKVVHGSVDIPALKASVPVIQPSTGKLPNLVFLENSLTHTPAAPRSGETVFFEATVVNRGIASATEVNVRGYVGDSDQEQKMEAAVGKSFARIDRLDPGEKRKVRLRWDPTNNTGQHEIALKIEERGRVEEHLEKKRVSTTIQVLRKADLVIGAEHVQITSLPGDRLQIDFEVLNQGESIAERVIIEIIVKLQGHEELQTMRIPRFLTIPAGESYKAGGIKIPSNIERLEIVVDPDEVVDEESHKNNRFVHP